MRILFLGGSFAAENGGIERYNLTLLKHLITLNHSVAAFSVNDLKDGIIQGFGRNQIKLIFSLFKASFFCDLFIIGHRNFLPLVLIPGFYFKPKILIAHGIEVWGTQKGAYRFFSLFLTRIWPVSSFTGQKIEIGWGIRIKQNIIPNTLPDIFQKLANELVKNKQKNNDPVRLLSVSRVAKSENYKNIDLCITAVLKWAETVQVDWKYDIVIHGDDTDRHVSLADGNSRIKFHNHIPDSDLKSLYNQASHFLLPSTGEGFGIVYLEAMSSGCICIAAGFGGVTDIIQNKSNGLLCPLPVDPGNIRDLLVYSLENENRTHLALNGWNSVSVFSFESVNLKIKNALDGIEKI